MNKAVFALCLVIAMLVLAGLTMFAPKAHAQGFDDQPTCYSWEGGHKSAGSFSKCTRWEVAKAPVAPPPAPVVVPPPVMQNVVCPPQVILEPVPQKHKAPIKRRPPPPKCQP